MHCSLKQLDTIIPDRSELELAVQALRLGRSKIDTNGII